MHVSVEVAGYGARASFTYTPNPAPLCRVLLLALLPLTVRSSGMRTGSSYGAAKQETTAPLPSEASSVKKSSQVLYVWVCAWGGREGGEAVRSVRA